MKAFDKELELRFILNFVESGDFGYTSYCVQLRSLWTAFCFHQDLECDTFEYDTALEAVWSKMRDNSSCFWIDDEDEGIIGFDLFEDFMCEEIV